MLLIPRRSWAKVFQRRGRLWCMQATYWWSPGIVRRLCSRDITTASALALALLAIAVSWLCVFAGVKHLYIKICNRCRRRVWRVGGSGQPRTCKLAKEWSSADTARLQWQYRMSILLQKIYSAVWKTFCIHAALCCCYSWVILHVILQDDAAAVTTDAFRHLLVHGKCESNIC